jgi:hypothetical protein
MKIYVATMIWWDKQLDFLHNAIASWNDTGYDVTLTIDTDREHDWSQYKNITIEEYVTETRQDGDWRCGPFWKHKPRMRGEVENYDIFVFQQADLLYQKKHVDYFVEEESLLPDDMTVGFILYEEWEGEKYFVNTVGGTYQGVKNSDFRYNGRPYFVFDPRYWASFMITRAQMKRCIELGAFGDKFKHRHYGQLESAAGEPYYVKAFTEVLYPWDRLDDCLVHHQTNKYVESGRSTSMVSLSEVREQGRLILESAPLAGS